MCLLFNQTSGFFPSPLEKVPGGRMRFLNGTEDAKKRK
jgi:hypothetical protein